MSRLSTFIAWLNALPKRQMNPIHKDSKSNEHKQNPDPLRVDIQSELRLPIAITEYYESEQHERECKNRREKLITCVEIGALGVAGFLAYFTWGTLQEVRSQTGAAIVAANAAKKSADVANATLVATQRPWVSLDASIEGDWEYTHGGNLEVRYRLKNHGATPAVKVYIGAALVTRNPGEDELIVGMQRKMCSFGKQEPPMNSKGGYTLFPQQDWIEHDGFNLGKRSVDMYLERTKVPEGFPKVFLVPFIVGCVTYRTTFDESVHQTPFVLMVGTKGSKITTDMQGIRIDKGRIPASLLSVLPTALEGVAVPD